MIVARYLVMYVLCCIQFLCIVHVYFFSSSSSYFNNVICFAGDETDGNQLIPEADGGDHESRDQRDGHLSHGLLYNLHHTE